ncbi:MAG: hypothetical protein A2939_02725 [Parcubacteria group bacterium RIFCSPLOWO2_01_FULL_48_18]|nr:MAG: hypothetical protein A2939_02725 [Parcubacteria group bacterium RIFCSPLOWO2_01_FULL_48_18]OHB23001.1 MAG: hypothetical protein A3J67_03860 [Parcubacteria group bacterium RIFCSPHIGHO2_02_FULL_48_10b]
MGFFTQWREKRKFRQRENEERKLLKKYPLRNVSATVFVRQPNGSKTSLEHYLEAELISRGARVVSADQQLGMEFLKQGTFALLAADIQVMLVGTLVVQDGVEVEEEEWLELKEDYETRKRVHLDRLDKWECSPTWEPKPKPLAKPQVKIHRYQGRRLQLSYRLVSSSGAILASGCREHGVRNSGLEDLAFRTIADSVLEQLMSENVWDQVDL